MSDADWELWGGLFKALHRQGRRVEELEQRVVALERRLSDGEAETGTILRLVQGRQAALEVQVSELRHEAGVIYVPLSMGKLAVVDADDFERIKGCTWFASKQRRAFYAFGRDARGAKVKLHRVIVGAKDGDTVDHINGDTLDNRKANLRLCTRAENARNVRARVTNTSGYKGVTLHKQSGKWMATICVNAKKKHIGLFTDLVEAAKAYDARAVKEFGDFAWLNFPKEKAGVTNPEVDELYERASADHCAEVGAGVR